jgi:putative flippase GtrA
MRVLLREAMGYAFASSCALLIDVLILWVLVRFFTWWYVAAATVSFMSGVVVAYFLSLKFAFKKHRLEDRRTEFASFAAIGTIGLVVNAAVIYISVRLLGVHYLVAKCVAAGFTFVCNFISRRQLLFVERTSIQRT